MQRDGGEKLIPLRIKASPLRQLKTSQQEEDVAVVLCVVGK